MSSNLAEIIGPVAEAMQNISNMFHRNIKLADGMLENFVKDVMTIYDRFSSVPSLAHTIVEQERRGRHNSLRDNIGKVVALASKTADQEEKWVMDSLQYYQVNQRYMQSETSKTFACKETRVMWASSLVDIQQQGPPTLCELFIRCFGDLPAICGCPAREDQVARPLIGRCRP